MKFGFGHALRRKEDDALLRGLGRYVADVSPSGVLYAVVLRSPHAHARFAFHDLARVRALPGVRLVLTAAEVAGLGPMPCHGLLEGVDIPVPLYPVLASGEVRHVGDAIAFVVAETLEAARDAAETIGVDWQPLPHVVGTMAALEPGAPQVWPDRPGNLAFEAEAGDAAATRSHPRRSRTPGSDRCRRRPHSRRGCHRPGLRRSRPDRRRSPRRLRSRRARCRTAHRSPGRSPQDSWCSPRWGRRPRR